MFLMKYLIANFSSLQFGTKNVPIRKHALFSTEGKKCRFETGGFNGRSGDEGIMVPL